MAKAGAIVQSAGDSKRDEVVREILGYLLRNPGAADSFDGIARWRLLEEVARRSVASTDAAMRWLIAEGFLREEKLAGGRTIYRLEPGRRQEIERMLREEESEPPPPERDG